MIKGFYVALFTLIVSGIFNFTFNLVHIGELEQKSAHTVYS